MLKLSLVFRTLIQFLLNCLGRDYKDTSFSGKTKELQLEHKLNDQLVRQKERLHLKSNANMNLGPSLNMENSI